MNRARVLALVAVTLLAAAARLAPHPPNVGPIAALALFGGAQFARAPLAFAVPMAAMLLSDLILGLTIHGSAFHPLMPFVYGSFALTVLLGRSIRRLRSPMAIPGMAAIASALFFAVTNLGFWLVSDRYPKTAEGLLACYVAALPFFRNTLAGDALYTMALFGGLAVAERALPMLRERPAAVA